MQKSRGVLLTVLALLYVLLAISDFSKPFSHSPGVGFVFMGVRQSGLGNAVIGPMFGVALLIYAYGIWTMRHYALPVAYIYAAFVVVNMVMFTIKNRNAPDQPSLVVAIISTAIGIGIPLGTAIILSRRQADLS